MKKRINVNEFVDELLTRIDEDKSIDCCKEEIQKLSLMAKEYMGDKLIEVNWKD